MAAPLAARRREPPPDYRPGGSSDQPEADRVDHRPRRVYSWLLALLLPAALVSTALAYPIEEHASDAATVHVYRGVVFSAARAEGAAYPRWAQPINAGLGGPLFSFYSPLVYYLTDALHAVGIAHPLAWRLVVALAFLLASSSAFGLGLALFGRADAALVGAATFTYAPHLLREHFERGSPEGLAIGLAPWLLWAMLGLAARPSAGRLALTAACWALMILAHGLAALLLLPVLGIFLAYLLLRHAARGTLLALLALAGGVLLAAFYVVPFLAEARYVQLENASRVAFTQPVANPVALADLLAPLLTLDAGLANNTMGQAIGPLQALVLATGPAVGLLLWRSRKAAAALVVGLSGLGYACLWLQTEAATWVWASVPASSILQFRWRLLSYLGLAAGLILGQVLVRCPERWRGLATGLLVAAAIGPQLPMLYPNLLQPRNDFPPVPSVAAAQAWELEGPYPGLTFFDEFRPRWRTRPYTEAEAQKAAATPIANLPSDGRITLDDRRNGAWSVRLETPRRFRAALNLLYFPGWEGYVDGSRRPLQPLEGPGYAEIEVPAGAHTLELRYVGTSAQRAGAIASGVAAVLLALVVLLYRAAPWLPARVRGGQDPRAPSAWWPTSGVQQGSLSATVSYVRPRWWLLAGLLLLVTAKVFWVDPHTTLFRWASTCQATHGAEVQVDVSFGSRVRLCGYHLESSSFRAGDEVRLTLYWERQTRGNEPANSFVHLLGTTVNPESGNPLWGQQDKDAPGQYPFDEWVLGKLYRDSYAFQIPPSTPAGTYQLEIGWWNPASGGRLQPRLGRPAEDLSVSNLDALLVSGIEVR